MTTLGNYINIRIKVLSLSISPCSWPHRGAAVLDLNAQSKLVGPIVSLVLG